MKSPRIPQQAASAFLLSLLVALACAPFAECGADEPAPVPSPVPARPQILNPRGGQLQLQFNAGQVRVTAATAGNAEAGKPLGQPPLMFLPGFPFHPLPNMAVAADARPGYLGVQLDVTPAEEDGAADVKEKDQAKKNAGVGIITVMEDSPAAKAGVKEGDRVLAVEGKAVKDSTQLRETIRAAKAGQIVKLTVRREGKEIDLKAKLVAPPEPDVVVQFAGENGPAAVPGIVLFNRIAAPAPRSSTVATGSDLDAVYLRDGNRFLGRIQRIDPAKGLLLKRESGPDLELIEEGIGSVTFAEREKGAPAPSRVSLQLRDGSCFRGDALTLEGGKIVLTLPGSHRLEFAREHALSATLSDGEAPQIYQGPVSIAGWSSMRSGQGNWDYKDGFLRCINNGSIGRNMERMPDPVDVSFDVVFPSQLHHFTVSLFQNASGVNQAGSLTVQFSPNQISATHFDGRRYNQYSAPIKLDERMSFTEKPVAIRYRLLVDRVNGRALVFTNGARRADWRISKVKPEEIGKCGAAFSISPNVFTSTNTFQLGRIGILPWDGKEPADGWEPADPKTDQIIRSHGDAIAGPVVRITEREIILGNPARPVARAETLHVRFVAPAVPSDDRPGAAALLRLKNGSEFTATKIEGTGSAMTLTTRFGSRITLPLSALRDMEFLRSPDQRDPAPAGGEVLTLTDGTQLKGAFLASVVGGNLLWKIAACREPLQFPESEVAGVFFPALKGSGRTASLHGSSAIRLGNGDWLPADIISLDANQVVVRSDLAAELSFPVSELRSLYLSPSLAATVADGATGPELWTRGLNPNRGFSTPRDGESSRKQEEPWAYHDGAYTLKSPSRIGSAMLARKWPAYDGAYALNFEVENAGRTGAFNLQLFNSKDDRTFTIYSFGGRVNVYCNPGSARMNRFGGAPKRFQVDEQPKAEARTIRISVVLDRPAKTFRLIMDNKEVGKMAFKTEEAKEALDVCGMSLTPMAGVTASGRQSRIANIWLAPWAGTVATAPEKPGPQEGEGRGTEPPATNESKTLALIHLANGDEFSAKVGGLNAELLTVTSEVGPLELPRQRVAWLNFPGSDAIAPGSFPRLRFHDSGMLSIKDLRIENDRVTCHALQGQALEFPLSVVKEIIYRPVVLE
jgi:hypothetical protein